MSGFVHRLLSLLGSFKLAFWLLVLLGLLTLVGTLEQRTMSLYDVQLKYFESLVLVYWIGDTVPLPLLGGYLLLTIFFVNIVIGGLIRLRKGRSTAGILIAHVGIVLLLGGSFVEHQLSTKGQLTLYEGEIGSAYRSSNEWEVVVRAIDADGGAREYVVPERVLAGLDAGDAARYVHADLPFDVLFMSFHRNARPRPVQPAEAETDVGVDGYVLQALEPVGPGDLINIPGVLASVEPRDGTRVQRGILWALQEFPWAVSMQMRQYQFDIRRRTWDLPFSIRLKQFVHRKHPGISMAAEFSSYVSKSQDGVLQDIHITMNEPLRHEGYTLYQSGWGPENAPPGTPMYSTFSVVANPSDRVPIWACITIALGLLLHFLRKLVLHLRVESHRRVPVSAALLVAALGLVALPATAAAEDVETSQAPWSDEVLEVAAVIPVQAQGRVKPLSTWARFALLAANHRRTCESADGAQLSAMAWWLDAVFRPRLAKEHRCFLVSTSEILDAYGQDTVVRRKRDRYSYNELAPDADTRMRLSALADRYYSIEGGTRSRVEDGILMLETALRNFEGLSHLVDFARVELEVQDPALEARVGTRGSTSLTELLEQSPALSRFVQEASHAADAGDLAPEADKLSELLNRAFMTTQDSSPLALLPPMNDRERAPEWLDVQTAAGLGLMRGQIDTAHIGLLRALGEMAASVDDPAAFLGHLRAYQATARSLAAARGEYDGVELEDAFYELDPFGTSLALYLIAFLLVALTWLRPGWRWLTHAAWALLYSTLFVHAVGIVMRCVVRQRPPISTLYETVIFVTAVGVLSMLVLEHLNRRRVALALAPVLGALGLFVAARYEILKGTDTMPQLVAVLDTNFWLATHVTCISIGYCAGLMASLIAHVYVLGKAVGWRAGDADFYRSVGRMVYGTLCFALLFSLVGTILGGIWANDSWGRFWGWDPKENGALLICITQIAILHGRMGALFSTLGVCIGAILGGCVVAFSWWGVNLLGIGLHSYGFTNGVMNSLILFWTVEAGVMGLGIFAWRRSRSAALTQRLG